MIFLGKIEAKKYFCDCKMKGFAEDKTENKITDLKIMVYTQNNEGIKEILIMCPICHSFDIVPYDEYLKNVKV